jgi:hypothetical protein
LTNGTPPAFCDQKFYFSGSLIGISRRGSQRSTDHRTLSVDPDPDRETISMKAYLITTGTVFGLIVLAHVWRVVAESPQLATDPWFVALTILAAALSIWAWRLLGRVAR